MSEFSNQEYLDYVRELVRVNDRTKFITLNSSHYIAMYDSNELELLNRVITEHVLDNVEVYRSLIEEGLSDDFSAILLKLPGLLKLIDEDVILNSSIKDDLKSIALDCYKDLKTEITLNHNKKSKSVIDYHKLMRLKEFTELLSLYDINNKSKDISK